MSNRRDERYRKSVGELVEPAGRPRAPGRLEVLQRFLNTLIHEFGVDRIGTASEATAWLSAAGLLPPGASVREADAAALRRLRDGLRRLVRANREGRVDPAAIEAVGREAERALLRVELDARGRSSLVPAGEGGRAAVAALLAIVHESQLDGTWSRLKACRQCSYAFYDRSKNRSGAWCSMRICGNRIKNRTYRRRTSGPG